MRNSTIIEDAGTPTAPPPYGNSANISGVDFTLNHPAASGNVGYILYNGSNAAIGGGTCSLANAVTNYWTCTVSNDGYAPVSQVMQLDVVAAN